VRFLTVAKFYLLPCADAPLHPALFQRLLRHPDFTMQQNLAEGNKKTIIKLETLNIFPEATTAAT
jgi:hypothetical protein